MPEQLYRLAEVAAATGLSIETVRAAVNSGRLAAINVSAGTGQRRHLRVSASALAAFTAGTTPRSEEDRGG